MWTRTDTRMREYATLPLFADFSQSDLRLVLGAATRLRVGAGTVLVRQGERGHQFVIVLDGTAEVLRDARPVDEIGAGGYFGEVALIRQIREPVSIVARTAMTVDLIERRDVIAKQEFATLYADVALFRQRLDRELDPRLAQWIPSADAPLPHTALGPVLLQSMLPDAEPAPTDNHQPARAPGSLTRLRGAARRMTVTRCRRASRRLARREPSRHE